MQRPHACAFGADLRTALHPFSASGAATWTPTYIPTRAAGSPYHIAYYGITNHILFWSRQVWHLFPSLYLPQLLSLLLLFLFPTSLTSFHLIFVFISSNCISMYSLYLFEGEISISVHHSHSFLFSFFLSNQRNTESERSTASFIQSTP